MKNVCGLDVHKDSIFMCIIKENGDKIEEKFGVLTPELDRLRDLLVYHSVGDIAWKVLVFIGFLSGVCYTAISTLS